MRDTLLSGAQVAEKYDVLLTGDKLYVLTKSLSKPHASVVHATGHVEVGLYVMDKPSPHTASFVNVERTAQGNTLMHGIFNHTADKGVDSIKRANPQGAERIMQDQGAL